MLLVSDIAVFVLKRDVKLQLTNSWMLLKVKSPGIFPRVKSGDPVLHNFCIRTLYMRISVICWTADMMSSVLWSGLLPSQASASGEASSWETVDRVVGSEEGETGDQRRLRRWKPRLHREPGRTLERPLRDRLAHWQRFFWTGKMCRVSYRVSNLCCY